MGQIRVDEIYMLFPHAVVHVPFRFSFSYNNRKNSVVKRFSKKGTHLIGTLYSVRICLFFVVIWEFGFCLFGNEIRLLVSLGTIYILYNNIPNRFGGG